MTSERKHPEYGVFPDRPPIFAVDEADAEAAIGIVHTAVPPEPASTGKEKASGPDKAGKGTPHPGMLGDGTEEQNLGQRGNPEARIQESDVDVAFNGKS